MKANPRGSMWRQWDLHCHTPSSFDYKTDLRTLAVEPPVMVVVPEAPKHPDCPDGVFRASWIA